MKRFTLSFSLSLLLLLPAFGQKKSHPCDDCNPIANFQCVDHLVQFDFQNPNCIALPKYIREGEFYRVQIDNINPNIYNIILEHDSFRISRPLSIPTLSGIDLSSIAEYLGDFSLPSFAPQVDDILKGVVDDIDGLDVGEISAFNKSFEAINFSWNPFTSPPPPSPSVEIKKRIQEQDELISGYAKILFEVNRILDKLQFELVTQKLNYYKTPISGSAINFNHYVTEYTKMREEISRTHHNITKSLERYTGFLSKDAIANYLKVEGNASLKAKAEAPLAKFKELMSKIVQFEQATNAPGIEKQLMPFLYLHKKDGFSSMPIQFHGEREKVQISFTPKDSSSGLQPLGPYTYIFPPKSNWYWSVGTSMYRSGLADERVGTETVAINDSTNGFQLFQEDQLEGELGVAALLRVGKKSRWINALFGTDQILGIHGSFGTGLSVGKDVRPRMLLGGGISIGKTHNLMFDAGYVIGYVDEVSQRAKEDLNRIYIDEPQPLVTQLKSAGFISIGYAYIF